MKSSAELTMKAVQLLAVAAAVGAALLAQRGGAQSPLTTLYEFPSSTTQYSAVPHGVVGGNGVLYGTTQFGGAAGAGTVFELQPPTSPGGSWTETDLYTFTGQNGDGAEPAGSPVVGPNGVLYGTTWYGGICIPNEPVCFGTVFELDPPSAPGGAWTEKVIYRFTSENGDGNQPLGKLVLGPGGALYGTAEDGGAFGYGTVFELKPPAGRGGLWSETTLYSFTGQNGDGANPNNLTMSDNGVLYGTTLDLFAGQAGTVFELKPPPTAGGAWTETVLHDFTGGADGCY